MGGIAGQAEPYVELDLDQSTINRLRTELDTLHTMVNGAAVTWTAAPASSIPTSTP